MTDILRAFAGVRSRVDSAAAHHTTAAPECASAAWVFCSASSAWVSIPPTAVSASAGSRPPTASFAWFSPSRAAAGGWRGASAPAAGDVGSFAAAAAATPAGVSAAIPATSWWLGPPSATPSAAPREFSSFPGSAVAATAAEEVVGAAEAAEAALWRVK